MSIYNAFASVYDLMQYDIDYQFWTEKLSDKINYYRVQPRRGLELACGTGTLSIGLSKKGFVMEGVDISDEMLAIAQQKSISSHQKVRFLCQDMSAFKTGKKYDFIFSMCDGINYVTEESDLISTFKNVFDHLEEEGIFIFDVSSYYKLSTVIGNQTFAETFEETAYIWENQFDEETGILEFELTLFNKVNERYERHEELHEQRAYRVTTLESLCTPYFEILEILDGDTFKEKEQTSQRICFVCRKKNNLE